MPLTLYFHVLFQPNFSIKVDLQAKPALVVTQKGPIRVPDIQALVLWVLADRKEGKNPGWAFVKVCVCTQGC